ncbi:hypothetical protein ES703_42672 [subsurface metagenome]
MPFKVSLTSLYLRLNSFLAWGRSLHMAWTSGMVKVLSLLRPTSSPLCSRLKLYLVSS